ncbi:hypothetical protein [Paractinoplanes ferrugineus]|uniref:hypothetical protein n=1 Tax=Paractinoplanes ferrugineus TaxID=113564 RepID=UPI001EF1BD29|nr:hypothetical protein [Actinoplanes ferrugineus]
MVDIDLAAVVVPYVTAAVAAYGSAIAQRVQDGAVDATTDGTARLGRRLLNRILRRGESEPAIAAAVQDVADRPDDADRVAALRSQIRKAIEADTVLAADVATLLGTDGATIDASGNRATAMYQNTGIVQTGDRSTAWQDRD